MPCPEKRQRAALAKRCQDCFSSKYIEFKRERERERERESKERAELTLAHALRASKNRAVGFISIRKLLDLNLKG